MHYKNSNFLISFGNNSNAPFTIEEFRNNIFTNKALLQNKISKNRIFLHQTHSNYGQIYKNNFSSFDYQGDYLITKEPEVEIGILTADCLPIIFYDSKNNVIAIAHSGWKGSLSGIVDKVLEDLKTNFFVDFNDLEIFFGPSAKKCCYEVSESFLENSKEDIFKASIIFRDKIIFDNVYYSKQRLMALGIKEEQINLDYNICTMCNLQFSSVRRLGVKSGLQPTTIKLIG